jgi:hypothetical protein
MSTSVGLQEPQSGWERISAKPLDEAVWQAWVAKGRAQERRGSEMRMKVVKLASVAALLIAAGLSSRFAPYDVVVRFIVVAAAIGAMLQAFHMRRYAFAGVFGALALFYNPVVPVYGLSGNWRGALLIASTVPFVVSLAWRNVRLAPND